MRICNVDMLAVACLEIRECLRNKTVYVIFALTLLFIILGRGCNTGKVTGTGLLLSPDMRQNIAVAVVFHLIAFWSLGLCGLIASGVIPKELEEKTVILVLSRPIKRTTFMSGKLLAILFVSVVNLFFLGCIFCLLLYSDTGYFNVTIINGYILLLLNLTFVAVSGFFISLLVPRVLAPLLGFIIYITSICFDIPFYFEKLRTIWKPSAAFKIVHLLFPKLGRLQFISESCITSAPSLNDCLIPVVNVMLYSVILWIMVILIFERKQL